jgi:hypothetical protein
MVITIDHLLTASFCLPVSGPIVCYILAQETQNRIDCLGSSACLAAHGISPRLLKYEYYRERCVELFQERRRFAQCGIISNLLTIALLAAGILTGQHLVYISIVCGYRAFAHHVDLITRDDKEEMEHLKIRLEVQEELAKARAFSARANRELQLQHIEHASN